ncbi:MAG: DUF1538 domain-containing protein [Firmicutes bacterium]|nr:DUF1538 domain-containing protein [Bacillota bacterium]
MHISEVGRLFAETMRGIVPITVFLIGFQLLVLRQPLENIRTLVLGVGLAATGLFLFSVGLQIGLLPLGETLGTNLPKRESVLLVIVFGFFLGYLATLAEPALLALSQEVDNLTQGAISSRMMVHIVALGVAVGVAGGLAKIIYKVPNSYILIPVYLLVIVLTWLSPEASTGIAYDSAGVTTGPVTVPLNLALAVGLSAVLGGRDPLLDGFGIIALASAGPIITVQLAGLIFRF